MMNDEKKRWRDKLLYFFAGVLSVGVVGVLLGAASDFQNNTLNYGRYQLSSWATQLDDQSGIVGAFVMDSVSGETRTVYMRTWGDTPRSLNASKNDLKKPFNSIK